MFMNIQSRYGKRFTPAYLIELGKKAARTGEKRKRWDQVDKDGTMIRISSAGKVSFVYRYKHDDKYRRMTVGTFNPEKANEDEPGMTLAEAVSEISRLRGLRHHQVDIVATESRKKHYTVKEIGKAFLKDEKSRPNGPKRTDIIEATVKKEIYPTLGDQFIDSVTLGDISRVIRSIRDRGANDPARRTLFQIRKLWRFAELNYDLKDNPASNLRPADYDLTSSGVRRRVLSDAEIKILWPLLDDTKTHNTWSTVRAGLKLLLLTAVRSSEIRNMQWQHIDLKNAVWTIPPQLHKAGESGKEDRPHRVPLSKLAIDILKSLKPSEDKSTYVLRNRNNDQLSEKVLTKALHRLQKRINRNKESSAGPMLTKLGLDLDDWEMFSAHDLRRTVSTRLTTLGVDPVIRERILAHSLGKLEAAYVQHDYLPEQRTALKKWESELMRIVNGTGRVIEITGKRHGN